MSLDVIRAKKKALEHEIALRLQEFCQDVRPSNLRIDIQTSRLTHFEEGAPVSIVFDVTLTCEV